MDLKAELLTQEFLKVHSEDFQGPVVTPLTLPVGVRPCVLRENREVEPSERWVWGIRRLLQKAEEGTGSLSLQSLLTAPAEAALSACDHSPQLS